MSQVRAALSQILHAIEPNPAFVVNRRYDVLLTNDAGLRLLEFFAPLWRWKNNIALMLFSPQGLRPAVENWAEVAAKVVRRLRGELSLASNGDAADQQILQQVAAVEAELGAREPPSPQQSILVPVKFRRDGLVLEMFTTITTVGTPLDITLHELRIEILFPATVEARQALTVVMQDDPD
jgi:hypothetical protein